MVAFDCFMAAINYTWLSSDIYTVSSWDVQRQVAHPLWFASDVMILLLMLIGASIVCWNNSYSWKVMSLTLEVKCKKKSQKHTHVYNWRGGVGWRWSGKIQAWVGPCFTGVTFWSDRPPRRHLIPLEGTQNEGGNRGRKKRVQKKEKECETEKERGRESESETEWERRE